MNVSKRWLKSATLYKFFARTYSGLDFSDAAAEAMYDYETYGKGYVSYAEKVDGKYNGYAVGKHLMDVQLAMWREDLNNVFMLTKHELFTDPDLEEIRWFLKQQFTIEPIYIHYDIRIPSTTR